MSRGKLNLFVDLLSLVAFLGLAMTGSLLVFALPPGSRQATLWGFTRHQWGDLHFWIAVGMIAMILVHVALHWSWVCLMFGKLLGSSGGPVSRMRRVVAAVCTIIILSVLMAGFILIARQSVVADEGGPRHRRQHDYSHLNSEMKLAGYLPGRLPVSKQMKVRLLP